MAASCVSAIACGSEVTAAMVNASLTSAFPKCGPSVGGTTVVLSGIGFFPTKILIKMNPTAGGKPLVVRGAFNQKDANTNGFVVFKTPPVAEGLYTLSLSLDDGFTFSDTSVTYASYGRMHVTAVSPLAVVEGCSTPIVVSGTGLGRPAEAVLKLTAANCPPVTLPLLEGPAGSLHCDCSNLPCGTYSAAISGNKQEFDDTGFTIFVHSPLALPSISPPCASIAGGAVVTVALSQVLHTAACTPLVMLSSCDSPVPAKFAADGASVTFTSPAVARASASNSLKFSANGGIDWTTAVDFPLFGQYTLADIHPSCGPWSGGTEVNLAGEGLVSSLAAAAKFVGTRTNADEGTTAEWSLGPVQCAYDAASSSLKLVTGAAEAQGEGPCTAKLHVTLDGLTWKETSVMFTFYSQPEWAEPKPKAFVVGTRGGAVLLSPATGTCVTSASVTVRFVCGSTQLEEVGTSDASGVTVQAPDFTEPGDYSVLVALNGKQFAASGPVVNVTAGKKK